MNHICEQIQKIILNPKEAWIESETEAPSKTTLFQGYLIYLAAIPAIAGFIGWLLQGENFFQSLFWALFHYGFNLAVVWLAAKVLVRISPNFDCEINETPAYRLYAFAFTPLLLSGIFLIIPGLSILLLLGLYGFVILFVGLGNSVNLAPEKLAIFAFTATLIGTIFYLITLVLTMHFSGLPDWLP